MHDGRGSSQRLVHGRSAGFGRAEQHPFVNASGPQAQLAKIVVNAVLVGVDRDARDAVVAGDSSRFPAGQNDSHRFSAVEKAGRLRHLDDIVSSRLQILEMIPAVGPGLIGLDKLAIPPQCDFDLRQPQFDRHAVGVHLALTVRVNVRVDKTGQAAIGQAIAKVVVVVDLTRGERDGIAARGRRGLDPTAFQRFTHRVGSRRCEEGILALGTGLGGLRHGISQAVGAGEFDGPIGQARFSRVSDSIAVLVVELQTADRRIAEVPEIAGDADADAAGEQCDLIGQGAVRSRDDPRPRPRERLLPGRVGQRLVDRVRSRRHAERITAAVAGRRRQIHRVAPSVGPGQVDRPPRQAGFSRVFDTIAVQILELHAALV